MELPGRNRHAGRGGLDAHKHQDSGYWIGKTLSLELGPVDEMDITYINGVEVGTSRIIANWNVPRYYQVPASLVNSGELQLAIRIVNTSGGGDLRTP